MYRIAWKHLFAGVKLYQALLLPVAAAALVVPVGIATVLCLQAVELVEFLQPMLAWDPADRPTAAELLLHPYFKPLEVERNAPS